MLMTQPARYGHSTRMHFGRWTETFHQASRRKAALLFLMPPRFGPRENRRLCRRFQSVLWSIARYSIQMARPLCSLPERASTHCMLEVGSVRRSASCSPWLIGKDAECDASCRCAASGKNSWHSAHATGTMGPEFSNHCCVHLRGFHHVVGDQPALLLSDHGVIIAL
jgi:hypothetical protein